MSVDWFTFTAQIINFLILVWLLKRFLYKPIIDAMDEREKNLALAKDQSLAAQQEAEAAADEHRRRTEELAHAKDDLLAEASRDVESWQHERIREARAEVEEARAQWYHALDRDRQAFIREARLRVATHVRRLSNRVLQELAAADLESRAIEVFRDRMTQIEEGRRASIAAAIRDSQKRIHIRSGFPIGEEGRARLMAFLREMMGADIEAEFREDPELIFGIEVRAAGHKLSWGASEQLEQLEEEFVHSLDEALSRETASETAA